MMKSFISWDVKAIILWLSEFPTLYYSQIEPGRFFLVVSIMMQFGILSSLNQYISSLKSSTSL